MFGFLFERLFSIVLGLRPRVEQLGPWARTFGCFFSDFLKSAVEYTAWMRMRTQTWWLKQNEPGNVHHEGPRGMGVTDPKPRVGASAVVGRPGATIRRV